MTVLRKCAVAAIATTMAFSVTAAGASEVRLAAVSGDVRINQGEGFLAAEAGAVLNFGDRVLTGDEAAAVIAYESCSVEVPAASLATVASADICSTPAQYSQLGDGPSLTTPMLIAGGLVVLGLGGVVAGIASAGGGGGGGGSGSGGAPISP